MAIIYKNDMFRVRTNLLKCEICKAPIRENNFAATCADCDAYICATCVRDGISANHICKDDYMEIPVYPVKSEPAATAFKQIRIYA